MDIFAYDDYRTALKDIVEFKKKSGDNMTFQTLAEGMDIPKSYVSKVLGKGAHFSTDQLFQACHELSLDEHQTRYLILLLECQRSAVVLRKKNLLQEIENLRTRQLETDKHISANSVETQTQDHTEYFLDPRNQIVHMALTVPDISNSSTQLARRLNIPQHVISKSLDTLRKAKLIEQKSHQYKLTNDSLHLSPDSPLYPAWRHQLRSLSLAKISDLPKDKCYSFSAVFTCNQNTKIQIRKEFLKFIALAEEMANQSTKEQVCQLNFDLHDWL